MPAHPEGGHGGPPLRTRHVYLARGTWHSGFLAQKRGWAPCPSVAGPSPTRSGAAGLALPARAIAPVVLLGRTPMLQNSAEQTQLGPTEKRGKFLRRKELRAIPCPAGSRKQTQFSRRTGCGNVPNGEGGIRTRGRDKPYTAFPRPLLRPLGHLSNGITSTVRQVRFYDRTRKRQAQKFARENEPRGW